MEEQWNQSTIQGYIDNLTEESLTLEYKGSEALGKTDAKKKEITKDVSAMANSNGGVILYGVKEYDEQDKRHLPQKIDAINRNEFSKEWIEQVINNIRPRIDGIVIHPVTIDSNQDEVVYAIEIQQSTTAHQATDHRYYKRFNFESVSMDDYEIRDVMNRLITPDASVEFKYRTLSKTSDLHEYALEVFVRNQGSLVINNFKLEFIFPNLIASMRHNIDGQPNAHFGTNKNGDYIISYRSMHVLFPKDEIDINQELAWCYKMDNVAYYKIGDAETRGKTPMVTWTLYADNMIPKHGSKAFYELQNF